MAWFSAIESAYEEGFGKGVRGLSTEDAQEMQKGEP
jgi:hypothetical protein